MPAIETGYNLPEILANLVYDYPGCSTEWLARMAGCANSTARRHLNTLRSDEMVRSRDTGFGYFARLEWYPPDLLGYHDKFAHDPVITFHAWRCPYCHEIHDTYPEWIHPDQTPMDRPVHVKLNERARGKANNER